MIDSCSEEETRSGKVKRWRVKKKRKKSHLRRNRRGRNYSGAKEDRKEKFSRYDKRDITEL